MRNAGLDGAQAGIKIAGRNINNLRYADDTTLMVESKELNSLLMKMNEESENFGLKLDIQKTKIMASSPITSRQIGGETMDTRLLHPWDFPGKSTGVGCHCLLQLPHSIVTVRRFCINTPVPSHLDRSNSEACVLL